MEPIDRPPRGGSPGETPFLEPSEKTGKLPLHLEESASKTDAIITKILKPPTSDTNVTLKVEREFEESAVLELSREALKSFDDRLVSQTPLPEDEEFELKGDFIKLFRESKFPLDRRVSAHLEEIATKLHLPKLATEIRIQRFENLVMNELKDHPESSLSGFLNLLKGLSFQDLLDFSLPLLTIISKLPRNKELSLLTHLLITERAVDSLGDDEIAKQFLFKYCPAITASNLSDLEMVRSQFIDFFRFGRFTPSLKFAFQLKKMADKLDLPEIAYEIRSQIHAFLKESSEIKIAAPEALEDFAELAKAKMYEDELLAEAMYFEKNIPPSSGENTLSFYLFADLAIHFSTNLLTTKNTSIKSKMVETLKKLKEKTPEDDYFLKIRGNIDLKIRQLEKSISSAG